LKSYGLEQFTEAIRLAPDFANAYYWRAKTHEKRCHKDVAIRDFRRAKEHGTSHIMEYTGLSAGEIAALQG
jgi:Tfp pilus assembly protein PilF